MTGMKRGGRHDRRARGGKLAKGHKIQVYNAQGSEAEKSATNEDPDFGRGGRAKRKAGGEAEGEHEEQRMDHEKRGAGGRANLRRGGKPMEEKDEDEKEMMKDGGHARRQAGGRAMAGGHSPYSSGRALTMGDGDQGRERQKVPPEPS
jgi:hypothetical protein